MSLYNEYDFVNEGASGDRSNIIKSSYHIYSHLMKINFHKDLNERWVNTICVQCSQLNKITNKSRWDEIVYDQSTLNSIRTKAIKEYEKDGNKYGDVQFNVIYNEFRI